MITTINTVEYKENITIKKTIILLIGIPIYISLNKIEREIVKQEKKIRILI